MKIDVNITHEQVSFIEKFYVTIPSFGEKTIIIPAQLSGLTLLEKKKVIRDQIIDELYFNFHHLKIGEKFWK